MVRSRNQPTSYTTRELQEGVLEDVLCDIVEPSTQTQMQDTVGTMLGSANNEQGVNNADMQIQERPEKDICTDSSTQLDIEGFELQSEQQLALERLYEATGGEQVTRSKMESAPPWLIQKALEDEINGAWDGAYEEVDERDLPAHANIISSHVVYKVKNEEGNTKRLKARLCPHGNRDREKGKIRTDSSNADFSLIRIMLSIARMLQLQ